MKVASIQVEIRDQETKEQRIQRVEKMMDSLQGYDLLVLPEIWATGYFNFDRYAEEAEELEGDFTSRMAAKARQLKAYVYAGSFVEKRDGKLFNTSVLFDREGNMVGSYRKIHLFRYGSREGELITRGEDIGVFDTSFGKVGLATCFDMRFPELFRKQVELGAEFLLITSCWPHARVGHWNLFNAVRALENQCFLISSNTAGTTKGIFLGGHSQVVDPWGVVVASAGEREAIVKAEIDPTQIKQIREEFPQLKFRVM